MWPAEFAYSVCESAGQPIAKQSADLAQSIRCPIYSFLLAVAFKVGFCSLFFSKILLVVGSGEPVVCGGLNLSDDGIAVGAGGG